MLVRSAFVVIAFILWISAPIGAGHCTSPYAEDVLVDGGGLYVDVDDDMAVWVYEESNGVPGLQSGPGSCHGMIESDSAVF